MSNFKHFTCCCVVGLSRGSIITPARNSYAVYTSALPTTSSELLPCEIRMWSPHTSPILPDDTVAYIKGSAVALCKNGVITILLEAVVLLAFPGDPSDSDVYESHIPDFGAADISILGYATSAAVSVTDGHSFTMATSDYVRNNITASNVMCVPFSFYACSCSSRMQVFVSEHSALAEHTSILSQLLSPC